MDTGINGTEGQGATSSPSAQTPAAPAAGADMVEKKRLDGALQKNRRTHADQSHPH